MRHHPGLRLALSTLSALLASALLAACSSTPPTRSGGDEPARSLTAATYSPTGNPSGDTLQHIVDALGESDSLSVQAEDLSLGHTNEDPGSDVLRLVRDGDVDLAVVPTRVFDLVGTTSFQGLQAPLRFVSTEQADAVLTDPVADTMLEPVGDLGLVPLALTFDALRDVKGYAGALTHPKHFTGQQIAARPSEVTRMTITALGATVYPKVGRPFEEDVEAGKVVALEDSINQSNLEGQGTSVANEILSFKANAIVVNADTWRTLTAAQQARLREAAVAAREFSTTDMANHLDLASAATRYCEEGHGDVVVASADDLSAMRDALEPVISELRRDPLTDRVIDRIDELAEEHPAATPVRPCFSSQPALLDYEPVAPLGDQTALDGTWRIEVDAQSLLDAGVGATEASNNQGIWTFRIGGGHLRPTLEGQAPCDSTFRIRADHLSVIFDEASGCSGDFTARFRLDGDHLWFDDTSGATSDIAPFYDAFFAGGLTRIGS